MVLGGISPSQDLSQHDTVNPITALVLVSLAGSSETTQCSKGTAAKEEGKGFFVLLFPHLYTLKATGSLKDVFCVAG